MYASKDDPQAAETVKAVQKIYGDKTPEIPEFLGCMARTNLPTSITAGTEYAASKLLEKALERIGMEGVKKAGPVAVGVTAAVTGAWCANEIRKQ